MDITLTYKMTSGSARAGCRSAIEALRRYDALKEAGASNITIWLGPGIVTLAELKVMARGQPMAGYPG